MNIMSDKDNDWIMNIGFIIVKLRSENQLSQENLAEKSDMHRTYLSEIEGGKRNPTLSVLKRIVDALDLSMSEFFKLVEEDNKK